jgi:hypothetical protein
MQMQSTKALVRWVLENSRREDWSVQGFGFMRMYLTRGDTSARVHIWNSKLRLEGVSDIHTHPWSFESLVVVGRLGNVRYTGIPEPAVRAASDQGGEARTCWTQNQSSLTEHVLERYLPGEQYTQRDDEIHRTVILQENTITVVARQLQVENPDHAYVFVPRGRPWGNAAPRPATAQEWHSIVGAALERL